MTAAAELYHVPVEDMHPDLQAAWTQLNKLTGDASFVEVFANAPELLNFVMGEFYSKIFFAGRLSQRAKQLARLKLSLVHGCRTCNKQNVPGAREAGISDDEIAALESGDLGVFPEQDRVVIEFTQLMTLGNMTDTVSSELLARMKQHYSDAEICELGVVTAVISGMAKLSFVLDLVEREEYCSFT
ncbi:MAG: carboxymuconolactone decarboxylase family protein [Xanthomonadales bacterium]|nr:carboxymuconolactone decarboxylase family protein [Xanthomonadales bacterium]